MSLLDRVSTTADLKKLPVSDLPKFCSELREFMISHVSKTGGHLASSLGAVEIIVALDYVFDPPEDHIVFDVGHQAYAHKILTSRKERFDSLRQFHGLSGFPKRSESSFDAFGTAHSSTSISAALGMAVSDRLHHKDSWSVAVIGDGALTGGMAIEALNHAGTYSDGIRLLIVLNDNDCSISPSVGALNHHLAKLVSTSTYSNVRNFWKRALSKFPIVRSVIKSMEQRTINFVAPPSTLFSAYDINYYGPVNGHDVVSLVEIFRNLKALDGPIVIHAVTKKGKGYDKAEADPTLYHGVGHFDARIGIVGRSPLMTFTDVFSKWVCDAAQKDPEVYAITPAMREGSGLVEYEKRFPERYRDVAIAEQHAVTFAAGLAAAGMHPVVAVYSTFAQRAYDQILHDVAIQNLPVVFALDRAGPVGADGETHHGVFDIAYLRSIPNLIIMAPSTGAMCYAMLDLALRTKAPAAVRYPRSAIPEGRLPEAIAPVAFGKAAWSVRAPAGPKSAVIFAFGPIVKLLEAPCRELGIALIDMRFVKPLDKAAVLEAAREYEFLFTAEDSAKAGGAGSAVSETLSGAGLAKPVYHFGLPDLFVGQGTIPELMRENGLDVRTVVARVQEIRGLSKAVLRKDEDLKKMNTMGVSAKADLFCEVLTKGELKNAFEQAAGLHKDVFILGGGSNTVFTSEKIDALVVKIGIRGVERVGENEDEVVFRAGAGENWNAFVERCVSLGFGGLENLALIYGTVGGAVAQNIGAYGAEVGGFVRSVEVFDPSAGSFKTLPASELSFSYRHSLFKEERGRGLVIVSADFALPRNWVPNLSYDGLKKALKSARPCPREVMDAVISIRRKKLPDPALVPSAGSYFKNPVVDRGLYKDLIGKVQDLVYYDIGGGRLKLSAGQLIDKAGFKGKGENGVICYAKHALILCNTGGASGGQVAAFADKIVKEVQSRFGVKLEPEPVYFPNGKHKEH